MYSKKMGYLLIGSLGGIVTNIGCNLLLIPTYKVMGAAVATAIAALVGASLNAYNGQKSYPLNIGFPKIALMIFLFLVFSLLLYPIQNYMDSFSIGIIIIKLFLILTFTMMVVQIGFISTNHLMGYKIFVFNLLKRSNN